MIQTSNNIAVYALVQTGYNGGLLLASIKKKEEQQAEKTITEPNTSARVAALAKAKMHGAQFHATHGTQSTSEDFFKSTELENCTVLREKLKKDKKLCLHQHGVQCKLILDTGKNAESLLDSELDALLAWHQVAKTNGSKKEDNLLWWWKDIIARNGQQHSSQFSRWTDDDEQKLAALMPDTVDIGDPYYRREQALQERKLEAAITA